ncbi:RNA polymerase ECF family sigma subunit [Arcticibacter tournemirensis]|uniref:RNA polymerase sigma factor n=1 Tax=Arcticibacter tournemirensis TaxID=699437 RepID=A0A5M9HB36_9SPHI|nr:RNA polymerase sigma factor [Arcticibacter tournemirensis]KAA8484173.1 RNA polymerase sigma factor [Arcticibacter tournemirensis]TQM51920.1 RNA polymerase ECF family sigma subunit [Arcticibacter tournemirensis]
MSDTELINEILRGNISCYKEIIEKYQPGVFRICMGFVHQKEDADDLSQEIFTNAFLGLSRFKGQAELSTWLYRIAVNACLNFKRKYVKDQVLLRSGTMEDMEEQIGSAFCNSESAADKLLMDKECADQVHRAMKNLPDKQRVAFILSKYEDLSQKQIAEVMGISVGAVEQLLQRAKKHLQKQLLLYYQTNYLKA